MAEQSERERIGEGLRLMRAFFRIKDSERRRVVLDLAEKMTRELAARGAHLQVVKSASPATEGIAGRPPHRNKPNTPG